MRLNHYGIHSYERYAEVLNSTPGEYEELINALTINVTEFFRNPEIFEAMKNSVIPQIVFSKREHQHKIIRVWSAGCSYGDEPYSMAIIFLEKLGQAKGKFTLTIIGTDIDEEALREAKDVIYPLARLKAVPEAILRKYFKEIDSDRFQLKDEVKSVVRFRDHNVINAPPLMHCDLILCRNLLIYFDKKLQEEVILKFYQSLNPGGFLVLGMVEALAGQTQNIFEHTNNRLRFYRKPVNPSLRRGEILPQEKIDEIVKEMLNS